MRELGINRIEVHVSGLSFHAGRLLVLRRALNRTLYPGLWEFGGGQIENGENFEDAVKRQLRDEAGVIVEPVALMKIYHIDTDGDQRKIPGLRFVCKITGFANKKEPQISAEHTEWRVGAARSLGEL